MKTLYKYKMANTYRGTIESLFVADPEAVKAAIGKTIYFGECLGKHSEVCGELEESELTAITTDVDFIAGFQSLGCTIGMNPLENIKEDEE